ncbi:hypothetical protein JST97_03085 [bacterium]|nr:hypothetical protein [bacterium]
MTLLRARCSAPILMVILGISGCGSDTSSFSNFSPAGGTTQTAVSRIFGKVQVDAPVKGGRVLLSDSRSARLSDLGNFQFPAARVPVPLWVGVETNVEGQLAHLETEMTQFPNPTTVVHVNIVTTIISRYHRLHPELSFVQAEEKVLKALDLFGRPSYQHSLRHPHSGFSEKNFLTDARLDGGFDAHLNHLVTAVDSVRLAPKVATGDIDFGKLASGLGDTIGKFLANKALGWGLSAIGLDNSNTQITDTLSQISAQLTQLQNDLNQLINQVQNLADSVLVQSISQNLNEITDRNAKYQNAVNGLYDESQVSALITDILQHGTWIQNIDQVQIPSNGSTGLMELTARKVSPRLVTTASQQNLQSQADYYQSYQLQAANMLVEAAHASNPVLGFDAERYLDQYFISAKRQNAILKLTTFVTPSELFPSSGIQAPSSTTDTLLIWPPAGSLGAKLGDLLAAVPPRMSPYPSVPDDILVDLTNNKVWEFSANGSMSLNSVYSFLTSYQLQGYKWRLPNLAEIQDLRRSLDATTLQSFNTQDSGCTPGFAGFVWTNTSEQANAIQGDRVRNQYIYNFQNDSNQSIGPYTTDSDSDGPKEPQDPNTRATPLEIPALLVADIPTAQYQPSLQITIQNGVNTSQCSALLVYSVSDANGNPVQKKLDVTDRAVWSLTINGSSDSVNVKAHIGNGPGDSGNIAFRQAIRPTDQVQVTASFGSLTANLAATPLTPDLTPQGLLLSPNRVVVAGVYPTSQRLTPTLVTNDGTFNNKIGTQFVTFTSDDPSVTITPGGTVTANQPTVTPKVVTVTATYNDGANPAVVGFSTFTLQPR